MNSKQRKILQVCLVIAIVSLVIMTIHSIVTHGGVESANIVPIIAIVVIVIALVRNSRGNSDK